jgi:hypothetical protein
MLDHVRCLAICANGRMLCLMTAVQGEPRPSNLEQGWTVDDSTFGARLALVRQRMQWNIKQAARECGIPAASWGTWEDGALPRRYTENCRLIANRTGCDYGWLVDGPHLRGSASVSVRNPHVAIQSPITHKPLSHRPRGREDSRRPEAIRRTSRLPRPDLGERD